MKSNSNKFNTIISSCNTSIGKIDLQKRHIHVENRIKELGFDLPKVAIPARGTYRVVQRSGNILYLSGHIPQKKDGSLITGKLRSFIEYLNT